MADVAEKLDDIEQRVMEGLKDFQRATVKRIDQLFRSGQKRVLVSDEVGLGKTLIARGTVAEFAKMRKEDHDDLVKVVYICSNSAIAQQNLNKLRIDSSLRAEDAGASRLTMQHLRIFQQENDDELRSRYIQLIPLTPDTSFRITSGCGMVQERALLYAILKRIPELSGKLDELNLVMQYWAAKSWQGWRDYYEREAISCDRNSGGRYFAYMTDKVGAEMRKRNQSCRSLMDELLRLCDDVRENGEIREEERTEYSHVLGQIRYIFAKVSLDRLEPDLVVMDEFQRFRFLLKSDPDTETGMLADKFFHSDQVYMLLLSATPYKMYSTMEEIDETQIDAHYSEFLDVMKFLYEEPEKNQKFREVWNNYSVQLKELTQGSMTILAAKNAAEDALYHSVCRTERISEKEMADIIDDSSVKAAVQITEADVKSYTELQSVFDKTGMKVNVPVSYVKSCPYLLSFMKEYKLKKNLEKYYREHPDRTAETKGKHLWLKKADLDHYRKIPYGNARLSQVMERVFDKNAECLLWVPPSRPYYELQGVFKGTEGFSKTIVFSAWEMVPRMLSCLISYEAERRSIGRLADKFKKKGVKYFYSGDRRYPPARLNFSVRDGQPGSMSLFCLLYPSEFLCHVYDPIACMRENMTASDIMRQVREKISEKLAYLPEDKQVRTDRRWYYMAPMLLDTEQYAEAWAEGLRQWIDGGYKTGWLADSEEDTGKSRKGFERHIDTLLDLYGRIRGNVYGQTQRNDREILGRKPDDLVEVLTDMAMASPAVCFRRTYQLYTDGKAEDTLEYPTQAALAFSRRMNTPESTAAVELALSRQRHRSEDAYWQNVLLYCRQGNLQAVLDEYAHMLTSGFDRNEELIKKLHGAVLSSMNIRTTQYSVDTWNSFDARMHGKKERPVNMRSHFAVAFTKGINRDSDADRKNTMRNAFNSPFRPFVLASTSIGQEGLDFHFYCRRIVHWNIPRNPIDLEQREGRINRFECLCIRQNIAKRYGNIEFRHDVWNEMFAEAARQEKQGNCSDLVPYWGLTDSEDMLKIERIVPMYPLSRDEEMYDRMIRILSLYRLTLGQARQEELLEYLFQNCKNPADLKKMFINLSPYYKNEAAVQENLDKNRLLPKGGKQEKENL